MTDRNDIFPIYTKIKHSRKNEMNEINTIKEEKQALEYVFLKKLITSTSNKIRVVVAIVTIQTLPTVWFHNIYMTMLASFSFAAMTTVDTITCHLVTVVRSVVARTQNTIVELLHLAMLTSVTFQ